MKDYELTVVFHPDLEMNIDPALEKVKNILEANHAIIKAETVDGKKRLSYKIAGQEFGVYYYFELQLNPEVINKISNVFNISDEVIRYLLVKADPRKEKLDKKRAERAEKTAKASDENAEAEKATTEEKEEE